MLTYPVMGHCAAHSYECSQYREVGNRKQYVTAQGQYLIKITETKVAEMKLFSSIFLSFCTDIHSSCLEDKNLDVY